MADGYSLQPLGDGWFRVSGVRINPRTGRYITAKKRESDDTTALLRCPICLDAYDDDMTECYQKPNGPDDSLNGWCATARLNWDECAPVTERTRADE